MTVVRPFRSVLYVPGSHLRAMEKASTLPVDAIIFDLEDAVASSDKDEARVRVCARLAAGGFGRCFVVVRINDPRSKTGAQDLQALEATRPDAVLLPKVQTAGDIVFVSSIIDGFEVTDGTPDLQIWAMMETTMGLLNAREIAALSKTRVPRLSAYVMGVNDLARETRVDQAAMEPWFMTCVLVAKAYGLTMIDGVYNDFSDPEGLRRQCKKGREWGMDGKSLIHPAQIAHCNEIFSPSKEELQEAGDIVELFEQTGNRNANVLELNGRMVERLHYEMARDLLQVAKLTGEPGE